MHSSILLMKMEFSFATILILKKEKRDSGNIIPQKATLLLSLAGSRFLKRFLKAETLDIPMGSGQILKKFREKYPKGLT